MKKLLVLSLVVGMASAANAAITIVGPATINKDDTVTIGVYVTDAVYYEAFLGFGYVSEGGFELSDPIYPWPPPDGYYPQPTVIDDFIWYEVFPPPDWTPVPGFWFATDLTCTSAGVDVFVVLLHSDLTTVLDTLTIHQVPEPMTLTLLGLGGLFLLRRRK